MQLRMTPLIRPFLITTALIASIGQKGMAENEADVVVYGSTPGGFCSAIAAAREGASVILLEPTDHVGAMNTGGLSHCDSNQMVRSTVMGLFDEWHTRVVKDYTDRGLKVPYNPAVKDQSLWTFEPHVAMRVTMQMLDEAGVRVLTNRYLKTVTKDGSRITSIVTGNGTFTGRVFVDGTYEGDLMAAGVDWTIGREGRESNNWHSADEAGRKKLWEAHKQYTLEFFHFLTTDLACPREFATDTPGSACAKTSSRDCQRIAFQGGGVINEGTIFPVRRANPKQGYAYHVPYRSIVPKPEQCDNLLVPVALSCTHVGISSLRIEGAWMIIGQSAGYFPNQGAEGRCISIVDELFGTRDPRHERSRDRH